MLLALPLCCFQKSALASYCISILGVRVLSECFIYKELLPNGRGGVGGGGGADKSVKKELMKFYQVRD